MLSYDLPAARFFQADGQEGVGTSSKIGYNPAREEIGKEPWATRPPAIGLAHELVHAEQAAYGHMRDGEVVNGTKPADDLGKTEETDVRELEAVGIPPHDEYQFSENKVRSEWEPPQEPRLWYQPFG